MSRNSTANMLNLDTQSQVSVVIFTYIFVRFLAGSEGLQGQSCSFEQVTKQPAKPQSRGGKRPSHTEQKATRRLQSPALTPLSSLFIGGRALPLCTGKEPLPRSGGSWQHGQPLL